MPGTIWERFEHDPRRAENAPLRASDKDRDLVQDLLGTSYAEGRLTREELDERTDRTAAAKTLGDLPAIVADLVSTSTSSRVPMTTADRHAEAELKYRQQRQQALFTFLVPTLICWAIFLGSGGGFPWPVFVTIGTGAGLARLLTNKRDTVASIERNLEKKERRRLEERERKDRRELGGPPAG